MTKPDTAQESRRRLMEAEATVRAALTSAHTLLTELEEEHRDLHREVLERRTEFYTERQFAALLKVSVSTLSRLRNRGKIEPLMVRGQYRYSSTHLAQVEELFAGKGKPRPFSVVKSKPGVGLG